MTAEYALRQAHPDTQTADPAARPLLEEAEAKLGFVPNMYRGMAIAPGVLDTYMHGYALFREQSGFSPAEQEVVFLTISRENGCSYCMAAHSMLADKVSGVPEDVLAAIRAGQEIPDAKLAALSTFTRVMFHSRAKPGKADVEAFLAAGYDEQAILQIILAFAVKTLSNYSNHITQPDVDDAFAGHAWQG